MAAMQVPVDGQPARCVVALGEAEGVATCGVAVLLPAVQLVLLLVEAVHEVTRASARQPVRVTNAVRRAGRARVGTGPRRRRNVCVDPERIAVVRGARRVEEMA